MCGSPSPTVGSTNFARSRRRSLWPCRQETKAGSTTTSSTQPAARPKWDEDIFSQVDPQRQGRLIYYQRERPRLADIEVWSQGDNIALGIVDGGGSVDLTGIFAGTPGFDGRYESNYLQLVWSPDPRFDNRGVLTLDLGARFWLSYFRMVGGISGVDEMVLRASDGTRDSNGNLKWEEIHRQQGGTVEQGFDELLQVRYLTLADILRPRGSGWRLQYRRPDPRIPALWSRSTVGGHSYFTDDRVAKRGPTRPH